MTLEPGLDSNEQISITWSGLENTPSDRYTVTYPQREYPSSHSSNLTISPLADQDDGLALTCTGTVTGGNSAQSASSSYEVIVNVKSKFT